MAKKWSQMSATERRARAQRLARNPATRASIPTEFLRGFAGADRLRAQRALNQRLDSPFVPGGTLTVRDAARERDAATNLKYGGAERQIAGQVADSQRFETQQLPAWYADYQRILGEARKQSEANTAQAVGQVGQLGGDLAAASTLKQGEINKTMEADAAARGATYDAKTASDVAERASAARRALTSGFGAMLATQGAANAQRYIDAQPIAHMRLGEDQARERGQRRKLTDDQLALAREKGDFGVQFTSDLRDKEGKSALERAVFGAETKQKAAQLEQNAAKERNDVNQWGYTNNEWRKLSPQRRNQIIAEQKKAGRAPRAPREPKYGIDAAEWDKMSPEQRRQAKKEWDKAGRKGSKSTSRKTNDSTGQAWVGMRNWVDKLLRENPGMGRREAVEHARRHHQDWFGSAKESLLSAALDLRFNPDGKVHPKNRAIVRDGGLYIDSKGRVYSGTMPKPQVLSTKAGGGKGSVNTFPNGPAVRMPRYVKRRWRKA